MDERPSELESALMKRIARGDERALADLYDRLSPLAYGLALRIAGDSGLAQDILQEAFLRVWNRAREYKRGRGSARAWVLRIVRNATIDQLRSRDSRKRAEENAWREPAEARQEGPDDGAIRREASLKLHNALSTLPAQQRRMIEIAYFQGLSHAEIAARENLPLGTVKTRIRDGVLRLRSLAVEGKIDG